jgi:hypothetical protein
MITKIREVQAEVGDYTYTVDATIDWHEEKNWGADADGNRGVTRLFIDDVILEDSEQTDENGKARMIVVEKLSAKVYCTLELAAMDRFDAGDGDHE